MVASTRGNLTRFDGRITGAAHSLAQRYGADPADVRSEITLAILERYAENPTFLDQTPAYVVNFGAWRARDVLRRHSHAPTLPYSPTDPWLAVDLQLAVAQALAGLDDTGRHIASGLAAGYTPREIGPALGISFTTVYNRMRGQLACALAEV